MSINIKIVFFDANNLDENESNENRPSNGLKSLTEIIDNFTLNHILVNFEKNVSKSKEVKYNFIYQIKPGKTVSCKFYIMNKISCLNNNLMTIDSFIIFINLENEETEKKLSNLLHFIKSSTYSNLNIYVIGLYKNKILKKLETKSMQKLIKNNNQLNEYYVVNCEEDKGFNDNNSDFNNVNEALENVFTKIYNDFVNKKANNEENTSNIIDENKDKSRCFIF